MLTADAKYKGTARQPRHQGCTLSRHKSSPKQYVRQRADVSLDLHVRFSMHENFKFDWQLRNNPRARPIRLEGNIVHLLRICRSRSKSIESVQFSSKRSDSQRSLVRCARSFENRPTVKTLAHLTQETVPDLTECGLNAN